MTNDLLKKVFLETLGRNRVDYLIMAGDWNAVHDYNLDMMGGIAQHANKNYQSHINNMIGEYGLCDIFRLSKGNERVFNHFNKTYKTASRLDFFLIDDNLPNFHVCETNISHGFSTDHISLNLQGTTIEKGMGYWKLNNSHQHDDEFVSKVNLIINETVNFSNDSYAGLGDVMKFKIKDYAIRYGKNKNKKYIAEKEKVMKKIEEIKKIENFIEDDRMRKELFEAEVNLNKIIDIETQGAITSENGFLTVQLVSFVIYTIQ